MADSITVEGKEYISSKRASELSGYTQDYIGQLARAQHIDAQRVSGLWYVFLESLENYKVAAEAYKPEPPQRKQGSDPDSLISFDGKDYVSASRAATITGYHQDYVGQLARSGIILARQVGNRWYVERDGIISHKKEKDALLAAVQTESVGLVRAEASKAALEAAEGSRGDEEPLFTYTSDSGDLMPDLEGQITSDQTAEEYRDTGIKRSATPMPIRVISGRKILKHTERVKRVKFGSVIHGKTIFYGMVGIIALGVFLVGVLEFGTPKIREMFAGGGTSGGSMSTPKKVSASAANVFDRIGDALETLVVPEIIYRRPQ